MKGIMKRLLFLLLCLTVRCQAQNGAIYELRGKQAKGQQVSYERNVPHSVRRAMPQGAKSLFWGRFTPEGSPFPIDAHYAMWRIDGRDQGVFEVYDGRSITRPKLLNRQFLSRSVFASHYYSSPLYDLKFYWLDAKQRIQPMFVLRAYEQEDYGPVGNDVFIVFPKGWQSYVTTDVFRVFSGHYSGICGQDDIVLRDPNGVAKVRVEVFLDTESPQDILDKEYRATFSWSDAGFFPDTPINGSLRANMDWSGWSRVPVSVEEKETKKD